MAGIPTAYDGKLGDVDTMAQGIKTMLVIMNHANENDRRRQRIVLRERLVDFCNMVMETADEAGNT
jgi:hypothetical protein